MGTLMIYAIVRKQRGTGSDALEVACASMDPAVRNMRHYDDLLNLARTVGQHPFDLLKDYPITLRSLFGAVDPDSPLMRDMCAWPMLAYKDLAAVLREVCDPLEVGVEVAFEVPVDPNAVINYLGLTFAQDLVEDMARILESRFSYRVK